MNNAASVQHVQICILTYRRPDLLRQALHSLLAQSILSDPGIVVHVLVVDNHQDQTGRSVFDEVLAARPVPARYLCEPTRGLSAARNRALNESQGMQFVAFLDDDEVADREWLAQLLRTAQTYDAGVVTGPVWPRHLHSPAWVVRGRFFDAVQRPTGTVVKFVATNNVLLRSEIVAAFRFDNRFGSTGGEDTEFFMRIGRAGNRMVWVNEAIVSESIPSDRANFHWLLSRARSDANRYTHSCLSLDGGWGTVCRRLAIALGGLCAGVGLLPLGLFGRQHTVRALQLISRSIGTVSALLGRQQAFYGASHG